MLSHADQFDAALQQLSQWYFQGKLKVLDLYVLLYLSSQYIVRVIAWLVCYFILLILRNYETKMCFRKFLATLISLPSNA